MILTAIMLAADHTMAYSRLAVDKPQIKVFIGAEASRKFVQDGKRMIRWP